MNTNNNMIPKCVGRGLAGDGDLSNLYKLNGKDSNKLLQLLRHFILIINIFKKEYFLCAIFNRYLYFI